ncbi:UNVERIFIED_CONTAM: hypothetical protein PYX00_007289 [Menopon gallinae]|uniref:DNA topoisomerase n=1 Tax=Menopon gallinae TaxID=328185 RepID=A0AAW2HIF9_9NEOP
MKVLNVAEKNDAAKNIAALLSRGTSRMRQGFSKYNKIYEFNCQVFGMNCNMIMTSVSGHLLNFDFTSISRNWTSCNPLYLFEAPIVKFCPKDYEDIKRTLEKEIKSCSKLIIWTDCDREGENIGFEIIEVCTAVKRNIDIYRAKFSEITQASVDRALRSLEHPNEKINTAVNVRRELDLRIGAAFTRFQTLHLKGAFPDALGTSLVSYGSCQFPTLGFVVERFKAIASFIPEKFWKISVQHVKDEKSVEFIWERNKLFNELACEVLYDMCKEDGVATVLSIESKPKTKWRPRPLDTVELEKLASRKLHLTAKETMKIAEKLYTLGYISYPRTETNIFPKEMNLKSLVENFVPDSVWGEFASRVLQDGPNPFQGSKSDQAHPPIHPTKYTTQLSGDERKLYDFIVRHFLACLSKHAEGLETIVKIDIAGEKFTAKGLMIIARNYLEIYPFDKWSDKEIHVYQKGERFSPDITMNESETSPPSLLTEADLIALMEKNGIGTDATHAEHIETIKARFYVGLSDKYFVPRTLGMGLVEGYDSMGFEMSKPHLRAELEQDLNRICEGVKQGDEVLATQLRKYKEVFQSAQTQVNKLNAAIQKYLNVQPQEGVQMEAMLSQIEKVKKCSKCGADIILRKKKTGEGKYLTCGGFPQCKEGMFFPGFVQDVEVTSDVCPKCQPNTYLLKFKFEKGSCYLPSNYVGCIGGCDPCLNTVLNPNNSNRLRDSRPLQNIDTNNTNRLQTHQNSSRLDTFSIITNDSGYSSNISNNSDCVNCNCGRPAARLTVKKQGPNCGREFYACGSEWNSNRCDFFTWVDGTRTQSGTVVRTNQINPSYGSNEETQMNCFCGLPSKRCEVHKEGPNKGRFFYSCNKPMSDQSRCSFFKWDDSSVSNDVSTSSFRNRNNSNRGGKSTAPRKKNSPSRKRKCGLCGEEGHNRKNCRRND